MKQTKKKACGFIDNFNPVSSLPLIASLLGIPHFHDQPHQGANRSISKQTVLSDNIFSLWTILASLVAPSFSSSASSLAFEKSGFWVLPLTFSLSFASSPIQVSTTVAMLASSTLNTLRTTLFVCNNFFCVLSEWVYEAKQVGLYRTKKGERLWYSLEANDSLLFWFCVQNRGVAGRVVWAHLGFTW